MSASINTNVASMLAMQNLSRTQSELTTTQARIATGQKVSSAKDNGAIYAIANNMRGSSIALNAVRESLQRGQSSTDVALAAGDVVSDLLNQMKEKALAASDTQLNTSSRNAMNADFVALRDQITKTVTNANFNGFNLIKGTPNTISALADETGTSKITVAGQDLSLNGGNVTVTATTSVGTQALAASTITLVNASIKNVSLALAKLGSGSKALTAHLGFVNKLQDAIDAGIGNIVDADLAKESARLQALQVQQ
ncbi:MAG: flagellin, partial [Phenylobacterium sp.]|uniref:flagellin n=1 Tax=Phenylobacterium sp. TaxID=1871053 RepID=UPI00301B0828